MQAPYDPLANAERPPLPQEARTLHAISSFGALATLDPREGVPYTSMTELLPLENGDVLFFLSDLAAHTTNLKKDVRASVLVWEPWLHDRVLSRQRMTLMGKLRQTEGEEIPHDDLKQAWLDRHPDAAGYIDFSDFHFYRLAVDRVRYIAGFGRMDWLDEEVWPQADPDPLAGSTGGIITHMNEDHRYNMVEYAHAFAALDWVEDAQMTGVDHLGFDMEVMGDAEESPASVRMMFSEPVETSMQVRKQLVQLSQRAREILPSDEEE